MDLADDEVTELLGEGARALAAAGVDVHWPKEVAHGMTDGAGALDAHGRLVDSGIRTTVTYVRLPEGL